ncbi:hypothetical protein BD779DRAFT_1558842 [Infundibulicybe gibba]|nr:hypothetical protein BD779DRAFT_1558842 [Infundibulicybe gibba]
MLTTPVRPDATPAHCPSPAPTTFILYHTPALAHACLSFARPVPIPTLAYISTPAYIPGFSHYPLLVPCSLARPLHSMPSNS